MNGSQMGRAAPAAGIILDAVRPAKLRRKLANVRNAATEKYARVMRPNDQLNVTPIGEGMRMISRSAAGRLAVDVQRSNRLHCDLAAAFFGEQCV